MERDWFMYCGINSELVRSSGRGLAFITRGPATAQGKQLMKDCGRGKTQHQLLASDLYIVVLCLLLITFLDT